MANVVAVVPDLMLASKVRESLTAAGHEVSAGRADDLDLEEVDLIVADVDDVSAEQIALQGVPVIGFHRHTDKESKKRAKKAGVDLVIPRSRMARELPELVDEVLKNAKTG